MLFVVELFLLFKGDIVWAGSCKLGSAPVVMIILSFLTLIFGYCGMLLTAFTNSTEYSFNNLDNVAPDILSLIPSYYLPD